MMLWLQDNAVGLLSILISGFIAYHVYFLSKRLTLRRRLVDRAEIQKTVAPLLEKMNTHGQARKVELLNIARYLSDYPHRNDLTREGYTYQGAEFKGASFMGLEFFAEMPRSVYEVSDGQYSFDKQAAEQVEPLVAFPVGLVPYEWIEYIDIRGDSVSFRPQFYVKFAGIERSPYKEMSYYRESPTYRPGDPFWMKYKEIAVV